MAAATFCFVSLTLHILQRPFLLLPSRYWRCSHQFFKLCLWLKFRHCIHICFTIFFNLKRFMIIKTPLIFHCINFKPLSISEIIKSVCKTETIKLYAESCFYRTVYALSMHSHSLISRINISSFVHCDWFGNDVDGNCGKSLCTGLN